MSEDKKDPVVAKRALASGAENEEFKKYPLTTRRLIWYKYKRWILAFVVGRNPGNFVKCPAGKVKGLCASFESLALNKSRLSTAIIDRS